ncbi:endonuclease NucS domain-containing protein [Kushneria phyllosphaerae]|nr:endonuclease NucS domain-containing protein [Kushneria phyllosphaerae]
MAQAIQSIVERAGYSLSSEDIKKKVEAAYPGKWRPTTLQAHLYACSVNNPKGYIHHPYATKFLYKNSDGTFEFYSEKKHGPNEWAPTEGEEDEGGAIELVEASISLERDIEEHLINNLHILEPGLTLVARQYNTEVGRIDILAEDKNGTRVIIELKVGGAKDSVIGQIARYVGWFAREDGQPPRSIIVASEFPEGVRYAATMIQGLTLLTYRVNFSFEQALLA